MRALDLITHLAHPSRENGITLRFGDDFLYTRIYEYSQGTRKRFRVIGFKGCRALQKGERAEPSEHPFKLDESLCRTRRTIRDIILCNRFTYFCTFTFSDCKVDRRDLLALSKAIREFFKNFRNRYAPDFKYIIVPERHKNGCWHFHGLISGMPAGEFVVPDSITVRDIETNRLKRVPNKKGYVRWNRYSVKFGHFDCSLIKHYEACAAYVSKYITKALADMAKSKHLYFCSAGLKKPDLVFDEDGVPFPFEQAEHEDEFCKISWASGDALIGTLLPEWYDEYCSELRQPEQLPKDMSRGQLESYLFEPLTFDSLMQSSPAQFR